MLWIRHGYIRGGFDYRYCNRRRGFKIQAMPKFPMCWQMLITSWDLSRRSPLRRFEATFIAPEVSRGSVWLNETFVSIPNIRRTCSPNCDISRERITDRDSSPNLCQCHSPCTRWFLLPTTHSYIIQYASLPLEETDLVSQRSPLSKMCITRDVPPHRYARCY